MTWLKICGITRVEDAVRCRDAGADAIGFIFAASPRQVSLAEVRTISQAVPNMIKVGVFVDAPLAEVQELRRQLELNIVQLHGRETNDYCRRLGGVLIKAIRPQSPIDLQQMDQYIDVWKILVDACVPGQMGGTGLTISSEILDSLKNRESIILAGGIGPENADTIVSTYHPFGLDCSSRLEKSPGVKDHAKIELLCNQVKGRHYEK
jgi:phosphoribosylanthranilate isomerase